MKRLLFLLLALCLLLALTSACGQAAPEPSDQPDQTAAQASCPSDCNGEQSADALLNYAQRPEAQVYSLLTQTAVGSTAEKAQDLLPYPLQEFGDFHNGDEYAASKDLASFSMFVFRGG